MTPNDMKKLIKRIEKLEEEIRLLRIELSRTDAVSRTIALSPEQRKRFDEMLDPLPADARGSEYLEANPGPYDGPYDAWATKGI